MRTVVVLVAALALSGCGADSSDAVAAAARSFDGALREGDVARACAALAPHTRQELEASSGRTCARALPAQGLPAVDRVTAVERYGRQASVTVRGADGTTDTWFLSRFDRRWLLVAASCRPRAGLPYDCEVEGP